MVGDVSKNRKAKEKKKKKIINSDL